MALTKRQRKVALVVVPVLACMLLLVLAEGLVRVRQYLKYGFTDTTELYTYDEKFELRIPVAGAVNGPISINSLGFRGPEIATPKPDNVIRIAYIGASTTYCAEVSGNDKVWTHIVSERLSESFPRVQFDYVNGGVPGYTTEASLKNLSGRIAPLQPDIVVIYHSTNDLSGELRRLASEAGIDRLNIAKTKSWLSEYSLLWKLVEMNLSIMAVQRGGTQQMLEADFATIPMGAAFANRLRQLVEMSRANGASVVALATFSVRLRPGQTAEELRAGSESARYYMPFMSPENLIVAYRRYNDVIRSVAEETGAVLIDDETSIPGDEAHFHDTVHFTDLGSERQAQRIADGLNSAVPVQALASLVADRTMSARIDPSVTGRPDSS